MGRKMRILVGGELPPADRKMPPCQAEFRTLLRCAMRAGGYKTTDKGGACAGETAAFVSCMSTSIASAGAKQDTYNYFLRSMRKVKNYLK